MIWVTFLSFWDRFWSISLSTKLALDCSVSKLCDRKENLLIRTFFCLSDFVSACADQPASNKPRTLKYRAIMMPRYYACKDGAALSLGICPAQYTLWLLFGGREHQWACSLSFTSLNSWQMYLTALVLISRHVLACWQPMDDCLGFKYLCLGDFAGTGVGFSWESFCWWPTQPDCGDGHPWKSVMK